MTSAFFGAFWHTYNVVHNHQHGYRVEKYIPYENELNMEGITYPVAVKDIPKFEKQDDISVNVYGYEDGILSSIHLKRSKGETCQPLTS